jgi:CDP-paratose 2-epimerase
MTTLITGGAGFIGTNMASSLLAQGERVIIYDDLSRAGVRDNLRRLRRLRTKGLLRVEIGDVRDAEHLGRVLTPGNDVTTVYHFAAQVAVTTSVADPLPDFGVNAAGTITLLEAVRRLPSVPTVLFTSTNKVYGGLEDLETTSRRLRHEPVDRHVRNAGVGLTRPLAFCSPYGCSKGAADQYVLDYAHTYGVPTVVFRMSCIYGPHQCGNEDQGWVAHFVKQALAHEPITLYGDGRQVRDLLYVDDLIDAMQRAVRHPQARSGRAFNIGGGPANTVSLLELVDLIESLLGRRPEIEFGDWRVGDQRWYVSDTTEFRRLTGWRPAVGVREGVERLVGWLEENGRGTGDNRRRGLLVEEAV